MSLRVRESRYRVRPEAYEPFYVLLPPCNAKQKNENDDEEE